MGNDAESQVLAGRYRLIDKLGEGGMGSVWRAEHLLLRSEVAIKLMDPEIADSEDASARFLREAQSAAALRSPHVVQILDFGFDGRTPFIAMELLQGQSLAERLALRGTLSPAETARILTHVARAIGKAHESGIVHRDLKPDNIFIVAGDDEEVCKVLDFGIAKKTSAGFGANTGPSTRTGAMLGTPYYMSPEQAGGKKAVDHRTDIWAMAIIAFECLTGARPFDDETIGGLVLAICTEEIPRPSSRGQVPLGFDEWFFKGTARRVEERFQSAREAVAVLRQICGLDRASAVPIDLSISAHQPPATSSGPYGAVSIPLDDLAAASAPTMATPSAPLSATAQQARPTSVTLGGSPRVSRTGLLIAAGAGAVLLLVVGGGSLVTYLALSGNGGAEPAAPALAEQAAEAPPAEPSTAPAPPPSPKPADDVLSLEDLPAEPVEAAADAGAPKTAAAPSPPGRAASAPPRPAAAPRPAAPPAPRPAAKPPKIDLAF